MKAMGDRQDIDALLVGALYGELDSDDRARLDAHLAIHPGDRAALDGLRSTRAMLRDGGIGTGYREVEPAASISARLLQEAARRAPVPQVGDGLFAWFANLLRPVGRHPALSAAAALVLIVGIGSVMKRRGDWKVAQPPADRAAHNEAARNELARNAVPATIADPEAVPGLGYRVDLDESAKADGDGDQALAGLGDQTATTTGTVTDGLAQRQTVDGKLALRAEPQRGDVAKDAPGRSAVTKGWRDSAGTAFLEVDKRAAGSDIALADPDAPSLDEAEGGRAADESIVAAIDRKQVQGAAPSGGPVGGGAVGAGRTGSGGAIGTGTAVRAPTSPPPPATSSPKPAAPKPGAPTPAAPKTGAPTPAAPTPAAPTPAAPTPDSGAATAAMKKREAENNTWAREQHTRMVKLVNAGKCTEAGQIGADIARKAPEYYQASVANDRAVRSCQSYVERARRAKAPAPSKSRVGNQQPGAADDAEIVK